MASGELDTLIDYKNQMRRAAYDARNAQPNKDGLSKIICDQFINLPEYSSAKTVMWYVDVRSEVRTRYHLPNALQGGKRIVIPYCVEGFLHLWWLESMDELVEGMWKILEPPTARWSDPHKKIDVKELDLIMVPGVGFDRNGGRMGNGKGYYDKLLVAARPDTLLVAIAFECQLFPEIPVGPHDIFMDKVITEKGIYQGKGRR
jgi:5-formyltetrahydrofolate cyclo-ligase